MLQVSVGAAHPQWLISNTSQASKGQVQPHSQAPLSWCTPLAHVMQRLERPTLIFDPREVPVVRAFSDAPPLAPSVWGIEALRARFLALANDCDWQPEFRGDGAGAGAGLETRPAAVLIPLIMHADEPTVLLTRRAERLRDHPGQISFPGGRVEPNDAGPVATALREAREEIGLEPVLVEILGQLPTYATVTKYAVTPVVGLVPPGASLSLDPNEVDESFEVPLRFLMTPAHHRLHVHETSQAKRQFLSIPWRAPNAQGEMQEYYIWGATAAILRNLYGLLASIIPR